MVADVDVILQPLDGTCPSIPSTIIEPPEGGAFVRIVGSIDLLVPHASTTFNVNEYSPPGDNISGATIILYIRKPEV